MSNLTPAYTGALEEVSRAHGKGAALVVQAVIEYKISLDIFERAMDEGHIEKFVREKLLAAFLEQIADSIATMCGLLGKSFKKDVMPLVDKVNEEAAKYSARHLQ